MNISISTVKTAPHTKDTYISDGVNNLIITKK